MSQFYGLPLTLTAGRPEAGLSAEWTVESLYPLDYLPQGAPDLLLG